MASARRWLIGIGLNGRKLQRVLDTATDEQTKAEAEVRAKMLGMGWDETFGGRANCPGLHPKVIQCRTK